MTNLRWALRHLNIGPKGVLTALIYGVLGAGSALALIGVSGWLIATAAKVQIIAALGVSVVLTRALGVSRGVFRYLERLSSHDVALTALAHLRATLFAALASAPLPHVARLRRGEWLRQMGRDVDTVGDTLVKGLLPVAVAWAVSIGAVIAVAVVTPSAVPWLVLGLVLAVVVAPWLAVRAARVATEGADRASHVAATVVHDTLEHRGELEVAGLLDGRVAELGEAQEAAGQSFARASVLRGVADGVAMVGWAIGLGGTLLAGWRDVAPFDSGGVSSVWFCMAVLVAMAAFDVAVVLPAAALEVVRGDQAAGRLRNVVDEGENQEAAAREHSEVDVRDTTAVHGVTGMRWSQLVVGWPGSRQCSVADGSVDAGDVVVVSGPSGAGKTTALLTLAGLLTPVSGSVTVRHAEGEIAPHVLESDCARDTFAVCVEDAHVFSTTVRENLQLLAGPRPDAELWQAVRVAGLESFVKKLPGELDADLVGGENALSGGERRRLVVARTLLSAAPVVLLDEPTEHLDDDTADAIVTSIAGWAAREGRAVVVATHDERFQRVAHATLTLTPHPNTAASKLTT